MKTCLAAYVSVVDEPIPFCSRARGALGVLAAPSKASVMAEAGGPQNPEADLEIRTPGRHMLTRLQVVGGRESVAFQRIKQV